MPTIGSTEATGEEDTPSTLASCTRPLALLPSTTGRIRGRLTPADAILRVRVRAQVSQREVREAGGKPSVVISALPWNLKEVRAPPAELRVL